MVIFQNYGLDVDSVQKAYEMQKNNPPVPRNAPPVSGNIMWSKQLLARIEEPMKKFADNKMIMSTKESKRIVKTYNKVGTAPKFKFSYTQLSISVLPIDSIML